MSAWHRNLPPEKARQQMATADRIREHFHVCHECKEPFTGPILWDCPPGSPKLWNLCPSCGPINRTA